MGRVSICCCSAIAPRRLSRFGGSAAGCGRRRRLRLRLALRVRRRHFGRQRLVDPQFARSQRVRHRLAVVRHHGRQTSDLYVARLAGLVDLDREHEFGRVLGDLQRFRLGRRVRRQTQQFRRASPAKSIFFSTLIANFGLLGLSSPAALSKAKLSTNRRCQLGHLAGDFDAPLPTVAVRDHDQRPVPIAALLLAVSGITPSLWSSGIEMEPDAPMPRRIVQQAHGDRLGEPLLALGDDFQMFGALAGDRGLGLARSRSQTARLRSRRRPCDRPRGPRRRDCSARERASSVGPMADDRHVGVDRPADHLGQRSVQRSIRRGGEQHRNRRAVGGHVAPFGRSDPAADLPASRSSRRPSSLPAALTIRAMRLPRGTGRTIGTYCCTSGKVIVSAGFDRRDLDAVDEVGPAARKWSYTWTK